MKSPHFNVVSACRSAALLLLGAGSTSSLHAEAEVPLHVQTTAYGTVRGNVTLSGTFLPTLPNGKRCLPDGQRDGGFQQRWSLWPRFNNTKVELGKSYTVSLYGDYFEYAQVSIVVPQVSRGDRQSSENLGRRAGRLCIQNRAAAPAPGSPDTPPRCRAWVCSGACPWENCPTVVRRGVGFLGTGLQSDWKDLLLEGNQLRIHLG
ncbi:MAG: hypothetical protein HS122_12930 [Opitutaceae bacterium]|nr:hypothetical protein [Opitutaceae bacterium]